MSKIAQKDSNYFENVSMLYKPIENYKTKNCSKF